MAFKIVAASVLVVVLCAHVGAVSAKPAETSEPVSTEVTAMKNGTEVVAPAPTPAPLSSTVFMKVKEFAQKILQVVHQKVMQMWKLAIEKVAVVLTGLTVDVSGQDINVLLPAPAAASMNATRTIA